MVRGSSTARCCDLGLLWLVTGPYCNNLGRSDVAATGRRRHFARHGSSPLRHDVFLFEATFFERRYRHRIPSGRHFITTMDNSAFTNRSPT